MDQEGHPSYGIALVYMDASKALTAEKTGLEQPPEDVPAGDAWQQRLEMRALALISRRPYFSLFKNILRYIFTVYASSYVVSDVEVALAIDRHRLLALRREQQPSESGSLTDREASADGIASQYSFPKGGQNQRRSRSGTLRRHYSTTDAEEKQLAGAVIAYSTPVTTNGAHARRHSMLRSFASEEVAGGGKTVVSSRHRSNAMGGNDSWELDQVDQIVPVTPRGSALELDTVGESSAPAAWDMVWRRALRVQYRPPQHKTRIRLPLEHFLCAVVEEAPPPQRGQWAEITLPRGIDLRYGHPHIPALPYSEQNNLRILFDSLSIPNILDVMAALLTEHIIFVLSSFSEKLTPCMDALRVLMFPLQCTATNISIVTPSFFATFADPAVYIFCGVTRDVFNDLKDTCDMSRPVIVDLENDIVRLPEMSDQSSHSDQYQDKSGGGGGGDESSQVFVPLPTLFRERADERLRHIDHFRRHGCPTLSPEGVPLSGEGSSVHSTMAAVDLAEVQAMQQSDSWILEVRLCFLELMLGLLDGFEQFLLVTPPAKAAAPAGASSSSGSGPARPAAVDRRGRTHHFDSKAFVASADIGTQPFLQLLVRTQSFGYFLQTFELVCSDPTTLAIRGMETTPQTLPMEQPGDGRPALGASAAKWAKHLARVTGDDQWWLAAAVTTDPTLQEDDAAPGEDSQPALMVTFLRVMRVIRAAIDETLLERGGPRQPDGKETKSRATKSPPKSFPWPVKMLKRSATSPANSVAEADATIRALQTRRWLPYSSPAVTKALACTALGYHRRWAEVRPLLASLHGDLPRPLVPAPTMTGSGTNAIVDSNGGGPGNSTNVNAPESWTAQAVFGRRGASGDPEGWGMHHKYPGLFLDKAILVLDAPRSRQGSVIEGDGDSTAVSAAAPEPPQWGSIRWVQDLPQLATFPFLDPTLFPKPRWDMVYSLRRDRRDRASMSGTPTSPPVANGSSSPTRKEKTNKKNARSSMPGPASSRSVATRSSRGSSSASSAPHIIAAESHPQQHGGAPEKHSSSTTSTATATAVPGGAATPLVAGNRPLSARGNASAGSGVVGSVPTGKKSARLGLSIALGEASSSNTPPPTRLKTPSSQEWAKARRRDVHFFTKAEGKTASPRSRSVTAQKRRPRHPSPGGGGFTQEVSPGREENTSQIATGSSKINNADAAAVSPGQEGEVSSPRVPPAASAADLSEFVVYPSSDPMSEVRRSHRRVQSYDVTNAIEIAGLLEDEEAREEQDDEHSEDEAADSDHAAAGAGGQILLHSLPKSRHRKPRRSKSVGALMQANIVRHAHLLIRRFEAAAAAAAARAREAREEVETYREAFAGSLAHLGNARAACSLIRDDWLRVKTELEAMQQAHEEAVSASEYQQKRAEVAEEQLAAATQSLASVRSQLEDTEEELEALMIDGEPPRAGRDTPVLGDPELRVQPVDHVGESRPSSAPQRPQQQQAWPQEFRALPMVGHAQMSPRGKQPQDKDPENLSGTVQELAFHIEELERLLREERDARQRLIDLLGIAEEAVPVLTSSPGISLAPDRKSAPLEANSVTSWLDFISRRVHRATQVAEKRLADARRNQRARAISRRTRLQAEAGYKEQWVQRKWEPRHREQLRHEMVVSLRRELVRQAQLLVDFDGALSRMERSTEEFMEFEHDETGGSSVSKVPQATGPAHACRSRLTHREGGHPHRPKTAHSGAKSTLPGAYSRRWQQDQHAQHDQQEQRHTGHPQPFPSADAPADSLSRDMDLVRNFLGERGVQS